jgi:hypothetical protein
MVMRRSVMEEVTVAKAKAHLSELIDRAGAASRFGSRGGESSSRRSPALRDK